MTALTLPKFIFHHCALCGDTSTCGTTMQNAAYCNQGCTITPPQTEMACKKGTVCNPDNAAVSLDLYVYLEKRNLDIGFLCTEQKSSSGTLNTPQSNTARGKQKASEHKRAQLNMRLECHKNKLHQTTSFIPENMGRTRILYLQWFSEVLQLIKEYCVPPRNGTN